MNMMLEAWLAGYLKNAIEDKTIKIFFFMQRHMPFHESSAVLAAYCNCICEKE